MSKWDSVNKCYDFLCEKEKAGKSFSADELATATGWKLASVKTYFNKKWSSIVTSSVSGKYLSKGVIALGIEGFKKLHTQKLDISSEPLRPYYTRSIDSLIDKSRDSVLLAVSTFNNPMLRFRSHGFIVHMIIGWTSLFHAILRSKVTPITTSIRTGIP